MRISFVPGDPASGDRKKLLFYARIVRGVQLYYCRGVAPVPSSAQHAVYVSSSTESRTLFSPLLATAAVLLRTTLVG